MRYLIFFFLLFLFSQSHAQRTANDVRDQFKYIFGQYNAQRVTSTALSDSTLRHPVRKKITHYFSLNSHGGYNRTIERYDQKGQPITQRNSEDFKLIGGVYYFYGATGNLDSTRVDYHGVLQYRDSYLYDTKGRISRSTSNNLNGPGAEVRYTYDEYNHVIESATLFSKQEAIVRLTYVNDLLSTGTGTVSYPALEKTDTTHQFQFNYDAAGRITGYHQEGIGPHSGAIEIIDGKPTPDEQTIQFDYDSSGYLIHQHSVAWGRETDTLFVYDTQHRLEKMHIVLKDWGTYDVLHPCSVNTLTDTFITVIDSSATISHYRQLRVLTRNKKGQIIREEESTIFQQLITPTKETRWKYNRAGREQKKMFWSYDRFTNTCHYTGGVIHRYDRHGNEKKFRSIDRHGNLSYMTKTRYRYY